MTRANSLAIRPLLPLEFCTIERAARLLDCEVGDIMHWARLGCVTIYINFDDQLLYHCTRLSLNKGVLKENLERASFGIRPSFPDFESADWRLYGLWGIAMNSAPIYINHYASNTAFTDRITLFAKQKLPQERVNSNSSNFSLIKHDAHAWIELHDKHILPTPILVYEDLEKLYRNIHTGQRFPINTDYNEQGATEKMLAAAERKQPRTTANQCRAIVELLTAHGFTDEDYQGSIEALQQKISRKGLGETLSCVDKNTLSNWLEKGGSRKGR